MPTIKDALDIIGNLNIRTKVKFIMMGIVFR